jgi:uncharacterized protein (TIGR02145 family)
MKILIMKHITFQLFLALVFMMAVSGCKEDGDSPSLTVTDIDGNIYNIVQIGDQYWMKSNLKTSKYNDGTTIPNVTAGGDNWGDLLSGAWCNYDNDPANNAAYGKLYNWYAVNTGKICPDGWHVPTAAEWTELTGELGGGAVAGGKMKSTTGWESPNTDASNSSGFSALPGGNRAEGGDFLFEGYIACWWTATEINPSAATFLRVGYDYGGVIGDNVGKNNGFSVRCVKD